MIDVLKLICVSDEPGFTIGKVYNYKFLRYAPFHSYKIILITNDFDEEIEHKLNQFIITFLAPSDIWVEYIDVSNDGLTNGKYYNLLERGVISLNDEHYYFLDDNNKFVGAWRGRRFCDVSKIKFRIDRLEELGI